MKGYTKWINIILALLLIFVILILSILTIYIVKNSSFIESETVLAGCLGLVGAIVGGVVTYLGVKETIQENRREDNENKLPKKIIRANNLIGQLNSTLSFVEFNLRLIEGKLLKFPSLSKLDISEIIETHHKVCDKINELIGKVLNQSELDISYENYEIIINFSNEFEKIKKNTLKTVSNYEYNFKMGEGEEDEDNTKAKIKENIEQYIVQIKELITKVEKERESDIVEYKTAIKAKK
ncbi:hypothetical protein QIX46_06080 [Lysinibacillus boronitolerans]|nr:hypothetical protein QIX46_06080 [Lysinibacillus boronitolerans]